MRGRVIEIPELCVVALIGASGSGKSTFARQHFKPTEILSSDFFRGLVSDDENDQAATKDAFESLHYLLAKRLARGRLTVIDATNVRAEDRRAIVEAARKYHCFAVAIVLDIPERICLERNETRADRDMGPHVIRRQAMELRRGLRGLEREGFRFVHVLGGTDDIEIRRTRAWNDKRDEHGPFDIFGDLHGCADELETMLAQLGYERGDGDVWRNSAGRKAIFLGDLVDRGPRVADTVRIVSAMVRAGSALCVAGNHDVKLARWLHGKQVQIRHGLEQSVAEMERLGPADRKEITEFLDGLVSHYVLDEGSLVTAHAGLREEMHGRTSGAVREFCLYGETTGETDEFGLPVRYPWASDYRGKSMVVYGHTPVPRVEWLNNTVNIDTGCVFGGALTVLRYPEREFVSIPAKREYARPVRPLAAIPVLTGQQELEDVLDLEDVTGKRVVETRLSGRITIREENSIAALEVMSRFATDPHWLIYLPPTMSPCETTEREGYLEYPEQAFGYFARNGITRVVCEEKHMGSRAVVVVCRDEETAVKRFGVTGGRTGACYTRSGRPFFPEPADEASFLERVRAAVTGAGLWELLDTGWLCLDCELMPWSAKAKELLVRQYAPAGAAGEGSLRAAVSALESSPAASELAARYRDRLADVTRYRDAYRRYCWTVHSLDDYRLAPFHLLASEGAVHFDKTNRWHMETLALLAKADPAFFVATPFIEVDPTGDVTEACQWWESLTGRGGEGMVIKPMDFIAKGPKGFIQPALKCRGREYLRIIYGPEYTAPDQLPRLRKRALGGKRSLAMREFSLGMEALHRFVERQPLRKVHECVFGVLAMESEPTDPRL